jgi:hypothetical protein
LHDDELGEEAASEKETAAGVREVTESVFRAKHGEAKERGWAPPAAVEG